MKSISNSENLIQNYKSAAKAYYLYRALLEEKYGKGYDPFIDLSVEEMCKAVSLSSDFKASAMWITSRADTEMEQTRLKQRISA